MHGASIPSGHWPPWVETLVPHPKSYRPVKHAPPAGESFTKSELRRERSTSEKTRNQASKVKIPRCKRLAPGAPARHSGRIDGWRNDWFHREMIHREISRVLVLHLLWLPRGTQNTGLHICVLSTPSFLSTGIQTQLPQNFSCNIVFLSQLHTP
jgi:hypothetical protein